MSYDHASRLADHVMKEAPCRSFHFSRPKTSAYWFNLTWIRGKLIRARGTQAWLAEGKGTDASS